MAKRHYIAYDGRAMGGNTDDASVLEALGGHPNLGAAIRDANECWSDCEYVLYSYEEQGDNYLDERFEHYHPVPSRRKKKRKKNRAPAK